ncbi:MAG: fucose pyrophosphorylase domain-containing protein, partial [Anaerolineae bacterium]
MSDGGAAAFLQQAHRNNWQRYLASLAPDARAGWDLCVITVNDSRQAAMCRRQLEWRREAGLLPARTGFVVLPDPPSACGRLGSGGATLHALRVALNSAWTEMVTRGEMPAIGRPLAGDRILIVHAGGDAAGIPHCSVTGRLFARVPRELPDGRASTIFDELLISLSGLAGDVPPGVLIASGDVLLVFDHLQLSFRRSGVIGVAAAAPA